MSAGADSFSSALAAPSTRARAGWLYGPLQDLTIWLLPAAVAIAGALLAQPGADGTGLRSPSFGFASWTAQYVLGNTWHVVLTGLLLAARPDILFTTPRQSRIVLVGAPVTFAVMVGFYWLTSRTFPGAEGFAIGFTTVFALHHTFAQVRGYWSLYGLRGGTLGLTRMDAAERKLLDLFNPLALLLVVFRWLLLPKIDAPVGYPPLVNVAPGENAFLPYWLVWPLVAIWGVYAVALARKLLAGPQVHVAKALYLGAYVLTVFAMIVFLDWGGIASAGMHGLEYLFITRKMLEPLEKDRGRWLGRAMVWPSLLFTLAPVVVLGLFRAPVIGALGLEAYGRWASTAFLVYGAITMAHYFTDAWIYRLRIPEVRKVALARLGFAP
jgi:hypothetical protein